MLVNLQIFLARLREKFWFWMAWHIPKKLVYFSAIRLVAFATQGEYGDTIVPELPAMEAVRRWETGRLSENEEHCRCEEIATIVVKGTSPICPACGRKRR